VISKRLEIGSLIAVVVTITGLILSVLLWNLPLLFPMSIGVTLLSLLALREGYSIKQIVRWFFNGARQTFPVVYFLTLIGVLIALWMLIGTIQ